ncbi:MAG: ABC transporter permease [Dehalococcoidia bacterium]|jgi:peptide/nickel transport system permease protein
MTSYIMRRLILAIIVLFLVSVFVFLAMRLLPGDPVLMFVSSSSVQEITDEQLEALRHEFGLDKTLPMQYLDWIFGVLRGDLGTSILNRSPVTQEILKRLPITIHLGAVAFIIAIIIGIPAGVLCAVRRGSWLDNLITTLSNIGITIPVFWLGIILIYVFALYFEWLPVMGYTSPFEDLWLSTKKIIMPVFCLALGPLAGNARQARSSMLEVIHKDYIRTAWSKGLRERTIIMKHALKNGLMPVVTLSGIGIGTILGGSVLIEQVFNIPGMGRLAVTSVMNQDYPYVQAIALIMAISIVLANLLVDISYGWLDPRVHYE